MELTLRRQPRVHPLLAAAHRNRSAGVGEIPQLDANGRPVLRNFSFGASYCNEFDAECVDWMLRYQGQQMRAQGARTPVYGDPDYDAYVEATNRAGTINIPWQAAALQNQQPPTGGGTPVNPAPAGPVSVIFTNLTSGNTARLTPGDRWQIQIRNAAPGKPVTVTGGKNGAQDTTQTGTTDASGSWSMNGQITAADLGRWSEIWKVGGAQVGSIAFEVTQASAAPQTPAGPTTSQSSAVIGQNVQVGDYSIPVWALAAAGIAAVFMLRK